MKCMPSVHTYIKEFKKTNKNILGLKTICSYGEKSCPASQSGFIAHWIKSSLNTSLGIPTLWPVLSFFSMKINPRATLISFQFVCLEMNVRISLINYPRLLKLNIRCQDKFGFEMPTLIIKKTHKAKNCCLRHLIGWRYLRLPARLFVGT